MSNNNAAWDPFALFKDIIQLSEGERPTHSGLFSRIPVDIEEKKTHVQAHFNMILVLIVCCL